MTGTTQQQTGSVRRYEATSVGLLPAWLCSGALYTTTNRVVWVLGRWLALMQKAVLWTTASPATQTNPLPVERLGELPMLCGVHAWCLWRTVFQAHSRQGLGPMQHAGRPPQQRQQQPSREQGGEGGKGTLTVRHHLPLRAWLVARPWQPRCWSWRAAAPGTGLSADRCVSGSGKCTASGRANPRTRESEHQSDEAFTRRCLQAPRGPVSGLP